MTDRRAPDPTLMSHPVGVMLCHVDDGPYEAHRIVTFASGPDAGMFGESACRRWSTSLTLPADRAAYIAVPCRECFPYAPPRGSAWTDSVQSFACRNPGLSWQVTRETAPR